MEKRDKQGRTEAEFLANYQPKDYPHPSVTADIVIFRNKGGNKEVLLIQRGNHPCLGMWALPGGFAEENEAVEKTALRELEEETHLKGIPLEPVRLFSTPGRDPRGWVMSETYVADVGDRVLKAQAGDDADDAVWFRIQVHENENELTLDFISEEKGQFHSVVTKCLIPGISGERTEYIMKDAGKLAFDHACMIAYAMQKTGYL